MDLFNKHLAFITIIVCLLICVTYANVEQQTNEKNEDTNVDSTPDKGRTFGQLKKLQFALLPVMYKLGVLSTVIMGILLLSAKSVFIGTILLIMNIAFFAIKIASLKQFHGGNTGWNGNSGGWNINSAPPVHVHIHNPEQSIPIPHYEPYGYPPGSSPSTYVKYPYR